MPGNRTRRVYCKSASLANSFGNEAVRRSLDCSLRGQTSAKTHCLILGFATEYSTSVRKFTATYVKPIARMQPCTR
jgi:hypothetical protein